MEGFELGLLPLDAGAASATSAAADGTRAYFAVDDTVAMGAQLLDAGATAQSDDHDVGDGIILRDFKDPWGNRFGVIFNPSFAPQLVQAAADDVSDRRIFRSARVPLSADKAWARWASEEGLAMWWTEHSRVDLRPGGAYEVYFMPDAPPGQRGADFCRVLSFLPGRMLSFTWNAPPSLPTTRTRYAWVVVTFDDVVLDDGTYGCEVTLDHLGWPSSGLDDDKTEWPATFAYFEDAWSRVLTLFAEKAA